MASNGKEINQELVYLKLDILDRLERYDLDYSKLRAYEEDKNSATDREYYAKDTSICPAVCHRCHIRGTGTGQNPIRENRIVNNRFRDIGIWK